MTEMSETILSMLSERAGEKTLCPSEVARAIAGSDEKAWRLLMKPIRAEAVRLAAEGQLTIRRKGKIVDPEDFKGIYRIGHPRADDAGGDGDEAGNGATPAEE